MVASKRFTILLTDASSRLKCGPIFGQVSRALTWDSLWAQTPFSGSVVCGTTYFFANDLTKRSLSHRFFILIEILPESFVNHCLIATANRISLVAELLDYFVVEEDRNASLSLLRNYGAPLTLTKIIFFFHSAFFLLKLPSGLKLCVLYPQSTRKQQPLSDPRHRSQQRQNVSFLLPEKRLDSSGNQEILVNICIAADFVNH